MSKEEKNAYDSLVAFINRFCVPPKEEQRLREIIKEINKQDAKQEAIEFGQKLGYSKPKAEELYSDYLQSKQSKT